jgi:hypothetical protein
LITATDLVGVSLEMPTTVIEANVFRGVVVALAVMAGALHVYAE